MKKKSLLLFVFVLLACFAGISQSNSASQKNKEHYRIINANQEDDLRYVKAMTKASVDSLRFLNERRQIPISGTTMVLELYSAQELKDTYGKPVSLLTIKDPAKARKVAVRLGKDGLIEVFEK